ncbi:MAG: flavodoxin [Syntrophomonadaceae bacterium]|nr:flavodoxin [Syntrophomonadaceae bacterium]
MERAIIVYGSNTGNTESLAGAVAEELQSRLDVTVQNVADISPDDILDYDLILLGSSTWNEGELQEDFQDFFEEMDRLDLSGKKVAVFGPGDSSWEEYCRAVDLLEEKSRELRADLIAPGFKWDGDIDEDAIAEIRKWASKLH